LKAGDLEDHVSMKEVHVRLVVVAMREHLDAAMTFKLC
jgi:hypothetical protein